MKLQETELRRILDAYLAGSATAAEKKLLTDFFESYEQEVRTEAATKGNYELLEAKILNRIKRRVNQPRTLVPVFWRIAASLLVIGLVTYLYTATSLSSKQQIDRPTAILVKSTTSGQKQTVKLPDGTVVKLNSNSTISFPEKFTMHSRNIELKGEAYFNVTHDPARPFIVYTTNAHTRVLGTSFNVKSNRSGNTEVTLVEGKVDVRMSDAANSIQLKPNQRAVISQLNTIDTSTVNVSRYIEWKDDVLAFNETPMEDVITQLENWYGVKIELKGKALNKCKITARYESESLENVMESFAFMLRGKYTINGKLITFSAKGCNGK